MRKNLAALFATMVDTAMRNELRLTDNYKAISFDRRVAKFYPDITKLLIDNDNLMLSFYDNSVFIKVGDDVLVVGDMSREIMSIGMFFYEVGVTKEFGKKLFTHIKGVLQKGGKGFFKEVLVGKTQKRVQKKKLDKRSLEGFYADMGSTGRGILHGKIPIDAEGVRLARRKCEDEKVVDALAKSSGCSVQLQDYVRWKYGEGEGDADIVDQMVVKLLGGKAAVAKQHGYLPEFLMFALGLEPGCIQTPVN